MSKSKTMAAAVSPAATKKSEVVAQTGEPSLPAFMSEVKMTGAGVATDQKDFLIPMAKVLDAKSPEVTKGRAEYFPGAEAGDIFVKNAPVQLIKGETGFIFQPCYRDEAVIEWLPRNKGGGGGGGFVERHPGNFLDTTTDKEQRPHPENPQKKIWFRKSTDNLLVETRYVGGYWITDNAPPLPLVLAFASTGHTVAKQWNMLMASKRVGNSPADIFAVYYRVHTRLRQRQDQAWYLLEIQDAGPVDPDTKLPTTVWVPTLADYQRGKALYESLASGARQFEQTPADDAQEAKSPDVM